MAVHKELHINNIVIIWQAHKVKVLKTMSRLSKL